MPTTDNGVSTYYYRPQTKLRKGNVFTGVCDSVHRVGGAWSRGGGGVSAATAAGITHPTGMYSSFKNVW